MQGGREGHLRFTIKNPAQWPGFLWAWKGVQLAEKASAEIHVGLVACPCIRPLNRQRKLGKPMPRCRFGNVPLDPRKVDLVATGFYVVVSHCYFSQW
jgi:hypothetical protein